VNSSAALASIEDHSWPGHRLDADGERAKEFQAFREQAERRLDILETAMSRNDLMRLPSNRFEALGGGRKGQFSVRINQQWRVCFEWPEGSGRPFNIEITDYHS
jgi:proteic killer suppression protein